MSTLDETDVHMILATLAYVVSGFSRTVRVP